MAIQAGQTVSVSDFTGMIWPSVSRSTPSQWLLCNGSAVSRSTYSALLAVLCPSATVTMTIASPCVVTWTSNTLNNNDIVVFTTTGALPTGLTAGTKYYVVSNAVDGAGKFRLSATAGGTAINTSGSQSGTHTAQIFTWGNGDGSTTFNIPDLRGRAIIGTGTGTKVATFVSRSSNVITVSGLSNEANNEFCTGTAVTYHTSSGVITGLSNDTVYYVIRTGNLTFSLATTLANAQNGTVISLSSDGSGTQTFTMTLSPRYIGNTGGEENHAMSKTELLAHIHTGTDKVVSGGSTTYSGSSATGGTDHQYQTDSTGGNAAMNVMLPFTALNYYIHI